MKSLLDKINVKLNAQGGFLKAVSVLVGGTAFAQLLGLLCLPLLTRLYTPADYSILGVYIAIVSTLAVIACLRFEIAIPISETDEEAKGLFYISLLSNISLTIILYIILYTINPLIQNFQIVKQLSIWIWLVPLGVFLSGVYSVLQYWSTRKKRFKEIAYTRINQAILSNSASLYVGISSGNFFGLILGQLLSFSGGVLKLIRSTFRDLQSIKSTFSLKEILFKYQDYPRYSSFESLANISAVQLPLIIIASTNIGPEVGYLMLAMKVLGIPMGLIGRAISQVYLSHAPTYYNNGELYKYTISISKKLLKIVIVPFIFLAITSPYIFDSIFGKQWEGLGSYVLMMIPWFFIQIISSPVSMALHIIGLQKLALKLQIFGLLLRVGVLGLVAILNSHLVVKYYILSGFLFYLVYMIVIFVSIKRNSRT